MKISCNPEKFMHMRMICILAIIVGFSVVFSPISYGQEKKIWSIDNCISQAIQSNLDIQNAGLNIKATEANKKSFLSNLYPSVDFIGNYQYFLEIPTTLVPSTAFGGTDPNKYTELRFGTAQAITGALQLNMPIFNYITLIGLKGLKYKENISTYTMEKTVENIIYNVSATYYNIQIANIATRLIEQNKENLEQTIAIMKHMKDEKIVAEDEIDKLEIGLNRIQNEYLSTESRKKQLYNLLKYLLNLPPTEELEIENEHWEKLVALYDKQPMTTVENLNDIKIKEMYIKLLEIDKGAALGRFLPTLDLTANYQYTGNNKVFDPFQNINHTWYPSSLIGIRLKIPIFQGLNNWHIQHQKKFEIQQEKNNLESLKKDKNRQILDAYQTYQTQKTIQLNNQHSFDLSNRIYENDQKKYENGLINITALLQSQNDLESSRNNYISSLIQLKKSELDYKKILGDLKTK